jgi:hypothetical protein
MKTRGASLIGGGVFLFAAVVTAACLAAFPITAAADVIGGGSMTITAQNVSTGGSASGTFTLTEESPGVMVWASPLSTGSEIMDEFGTVYGYVKSLECGYEGDPEVRLKFDVQAPTAADTVFTIPSLAVSFAAMNNPRAVASASITLTSGTNPASATGQYSGEKAYTAIYNGTTNWAYLVDTVTVGPDDSNTGKGRRPELPAVDEVIPASVSSIQAAYSFKLTKGDEASGTSRFALTPEPATLGLMGLGLATMLLRRRAR